MNDDLVVQKILKLLENNTAFIGYALNGGIGTKINVRNTETGKTIQALSINVDSTGEVLVVKDSADNQYKAVTFKTAEKVSERIIQLRKTKPIDDKKVIEYTDSDIEVFYLFVKLIDTGSPVPSQLTSTWIRKGSSCTQFVGAYERCNYASKETIGGVSYTGLPYKPYETLQDCLNDDLGRDAKTPHGTKDENGLGSGVRIYSTKMTSTQEQNLLAALTSHDNHYGTNMRKLFGYGSILDCSGGMYVQGWELVYDSVKEEHFFQCDFGYFPGFASDCTTPLQDAGYCTVVGAYINSKAPPPGDPGVGGINNSWAYEYGWVNYSYDFYYRRHFIPLYVNGAAAQGSFLIMQVNEDQTPTIPEGYFPWVPGCPADGQGGPYDGSGGNRFPDGVPPIQKRDMKLSTHKTEIWLGSSKKKEALKLYELGASDLFSGMYNSFILPANESQKDIQERLNLNNPISQEDQFLHEKFYQNRNKNIIDLRIDPRVWIYIIDNIPRANYTFPSLDQSPIEIQNSTLQLMIDNLYNRTINLTVLDKKTQVIHLKLGLTPSSNLSNTDCKGSVGFNFPISISDMLPGQSWEYKKYVTIKIKNWEIESTTNNLDIADISTDTWNRNYINYKFFTFFPVDNKQNSFSNSSALPKDSPNAILLRPNNNITLTDLISGNNYEQYNYNQSITKQFTSGGQQMMSVFANSSSFLKKTVSFTDGQRSGLRSTSSWWALWENTLLSSSKRLNSIVGYELNAYQILTSYGLSSTLNYIVTPNNNQVNANSYWEYLPNRPLIYVPSNIKSIRSKVIPNSQLYLADKNQINSTFGINFYFANKFTQWSQYQTENRTDDKNAPFLTSPSAFYTENNTYFQTKEEDLLDIARGAGYSNNRRFDSIRWINKLWTQLVFDGFINVDVDSYKNVEFTLPSNPNQYIKYVANKEYANSEYPFILFKTDSNTQHLDQTLETVLSPGTLDITKQVKITKPTNVDLDPNYSFLVYIYPFVEVTKKKKTI